ncbi:MAG: acetyl-CoA carboxylase biotin carboxylase subunit [Sulfurimonas sp.]|jgi:pyruvate carboxylase subunit A
MNSIAKKKISKILIANRGEIALRIIRACKEMDILSVAIFSEVDVEGIWIKKADECYPMMGDPMQAYLNYDPIIALAKKASCDAIHPGYGFLSENAEFAQACADNGIIFIGPKPEHIALFGDKMASKIAMKQVGVPILEGTDEPITDKKEAAKIAAEIGFPIILKAAFGGGGRGMRIVRKADEFENLFDSATQEALKYFKKGEMFIEKYVENSRHIEVQIIADKHGNVLHLGERDCSIQRRHQKVIEISPSPRLNSEVRKELLRISTKAMFKLGYESVGTIEFLVDDNDNIFFIEVNTRVQVEHPVTELISGIDIVQGMIEIAEGEKLKFLQEEIQFRGYAIEFRINAENPNNNFMPSSGTITSYITPGGPGVRLDTGAYAGYTMPTNYDSMLGKLIVWAMDWEGAVKKAKRALDEYYIDGFPTNIILHREIVKDKDFIDGYLTTNYLDKKVELFNLNSEKSAKEEEERMSALMNFIERLKLNKVITRY